MADTGFPHTFFLLFNYLCLHYNLEGLFSPQVMLSFVFRLQNIHFAIKMYIQSGHLQGFKEQLWDSICSWNSQDGHFWLNHVKFIPQSFVTSNTNSKSSRLGQCTYLYRSMIGHYSYWECFLKVHSTLFAQLFCPQLCRKMERIKHFYFTCSACRWDMAQNVKFPVKEKH